MVRFGIHQRGDQHFAPVGAKTRYEYLFFGRHPQRETAHRRRQVLEVVVGRRRGCRPFQAVSIPRIIACHFARFAAEKDVGYEEQAAQRQSGMRPLLQSN